MCVKTTVSSTKKTMPNSGDAASRKCCSGVLSRLLCAGSLPTHPSEQLIEKLGDQKPGNSIKQVVGTSAVTSSSPGVVARLMGLESFPTTPRDRTLGAYFRSKSVNSIDFLSYFDPIKHGNHRRVRTSVSFHYQGVSHDFASKVLHESRDEEGELFIRKWPDVRYQNQEEEEKVKKETGRPKNREYFQVSNMPGKNGEYFQVCNMPGKNREYFQDSGLGELASQKKVFQKKTSVKLKEKRPIIKAENSKAEMVGSKRVKRKKNKMLVHCNKKIHPEGVVPEVAKSSRKQLRSQTAKSGSPYSRNSYPEDVSIIENAIIAVKIERKLKTEESCYYKRMVEEICMLSEEDVKENWIHGRALKFEDFEEIIQQLGHEILQVLLNQFVDELVLLFGTRNKY